MKRQFEMGMAFILVLILLTLTSLLAAHILAQSMLVKIRSFSLQDQCTEWSNLDQKLLNKEMELLKKTKEQMQEGKWQQKVDESIFYPDHLEFGCHEGVILMPVKEQYLESVIVLRF